MRDLTENVKQSALDCGFDFVGISAAEPLEADRERFSAWRDKGFAGTMQYLEKETPRRWAPQDAMPEAKSVISLGVGFFSKTQAEPKIGYGRVARYAWGKDYHDVIRFKLEEWCKALPGIAGRAVQSKVFVDSGSLLERAFAIAGGAGTVGKNALLIRPGLGSFFFLSEVLTDLPLQPDDPFQNDLCGACAKCLETCPTQAFESARMLDARKCIAYWTIESKGEIPEGLRGKFGDWIFGCDECQNVCPHNAKVQATEWKEFLPGSGAGPYLSLLEMLSIETNEEFKKKFFGTPILRAKRSGLIRNACIVAANQRFREALPLLQRLSSNSDPIIRTHAVWAQDQIR
jgi:epoxyqueuosine reductase